MHDAMADEASLTEPYIAARDATVSALPRLGALLTERHLAAVTLSELMRGFPSQLSSESGQKLSRRNVQRFRDTRSGHTSSTRPMGVFALTARTVIQQLVTLVGNIYLARILGPADFGAFWIVQFALSFFVLFGDAGFGAALIQKKEPATHGGAVERLLGPDAAWGRGRSGRIHRSPLGRLAWSDLPN